MTESAASNGGSGRDSTSLRIGGGAVGFNWLPVFAAQQQGFFARHGLNVEIKRMGTVDKATAAVKSGELHMAITPPEGAIRDCAGGGSLRIIAGNVNRLPLSLIANPRFRRIEELRGAKLGTSSLTEGTALYTMEVLRRHGLAYPGDYEFAVVGVHPARWKALQEGSIDAAVRSRASVRRSAMLWLRFASAVGAMSNRLPRCGLGTRKRADMVRADADRGSQGARRRPT